MIEKSYSQVMGENSSYLTIKLDLSEPVEVVDFARFFASIAIQFDEYIAKNHPDLRGEAKIYIREVRRGSIVADLFPNMDTLIQYMDQILIVAGFASLLSRRVRRYIIGDRIPGATKSALGHIGDMVKSVAKDSGGRMTIQRLEYKNNVWGEHLELDMTTTEARAAVQALEDHRRALDKPEGADFKNVAMVFYQPNLNSPDPGKKSGEKVIIEKIDLKPKPIVYESTMAKDRIKAEFDKTGVSIFKKIFFVDVNVEIIGGKNTVYRIVHVHDVVEMPDEDD